MPLLLELFAGTGSISHVFREAGWETVSLDNDPKSQPDIIADILEWDYKAHFLPGSVDAIWASPLVPNTALLERRQDYHEI